MNRIFPLSLLLLAQALTAVLPASAQTPAPSPTAPAAASGAASAAEPSKSCLTARKKEDKEQRSLTAANESIAKDLKARESCSSKSMCARYDAAIADMEKKKARHETRLARFTEDVANACKP
jgi:hypothetical protein